MKDKTGKIFEELQSEINAFADWRQSAFELLVLKILFFIAYILLFEIAREAQNKRLEEILSNQLTDN